MAEDSLLAALMGNYGSSEDAADNLSTVRGLLSYCRKWPQQITADELNNPCFEMAVRLREGAEQMQESLRQNPEMSTCSSSPIARTAEAYLAIAEVLEELPELARDERMEDFLDNLDLFEQERQAVLQAQEEIELHLSGKVALCPRCGSQGPEPSCPSCALSRLYPDPTALAHDEEYSQVEGIYATVYQAFQEAVLGQGPLETLWRALSELEVHLEQLLESRGQLAARLSQELRTAPQEEDDLLEALLAAMKKEIQAGLAGAGRMKAAQESARVYDLSRGWDDIFHANQAIEVTASRIRREL